MDYAFHTEQMTPHADELAGLLNGLRPATAKVPIVSTVTGRTASSTDFGAGYWSRNVRQPVLFAPAIAALAEGGHSVFLEIGPHPVLGSSIEQCLEGKGDDPVVVGSRTKSSGPRVAAHGSRIAICSRVHSRLEPSLHDGSTCPRSHLLMAERTLLGGVPSGICHEGSPVR